MSQLQVTGEAKIRDIQGPVVANSGVITALDGAANQYVRGDGTLAIFPSSSGGGSSVSYYLNGSVNQGTFGGSTYYQMSRNAIVGTGTNFSTSSDGLIAQFITDANDPDVVSIPSGNWNVEFFMNVSASSGALASFYVEIYKYNGSTFTLLATNVATPEQLTNTTTVDAYFTSVAMPLSAMAVTDRLAVRIFANVASKTVTLYTEDNRLCQIVTTFSNGLTSLNNLTDQSQYLTTGTSGTDFNIVSSGDTHTFNIPSASASNRGLITTGSQTIAGIKTLSVPSQFEQGLYLKQNMNLFQAGYIGLGASTTGLIVGLSGGGFGTLNFNNTTSFTYTFPDASGTVALTSNLSSYVPYTGATQSVNLGTYGLKAGLITTEGGYNFKILASGTLFENGYSVLSSVAGNVSISQAISAGNLKSFTFDFSSWATNTFYTYALPASDGTIALTSNLSSYVPYTGATTNVNLGVYSLTANQVIAGGAGVNNAGTFTTYDGGVATLLVGSTGNLKFFPLWNPSIGARINAENSAGSAYIPLSFYATAINLNAPTTLTGALSGTSATFSGGVSADVGSAIPSIQVKNVSTDAPFIGFYRGGTLRNTFQLLTDGSFRLTDASLVANAGLTMGALSGTSATFSSSVNAGGLLTVNVPTDNTTVGIFHAGGGTANRGLKISTFAATNDNAGVTLDAQTSTGVLAFATAGTERMRITSGGNVGIGTSDPNVYGFGGALLTLSTTTTYANMIIASSGTNGAGISLGNQTIRRAEIEAANGSNLIFKTNTGNSGTGVAEKMRITSGGYTKISSNGTYLGATGTYHEIRQTATSQNTLIITNIGGDPYGVDISYPNSSPNNTTNNFLYCPDSTAIRAAIRSNGGLANYQSNNVNLSDERTKKDIIPLESYWNKFKAIEIVKFKYKDQTHDDFNIGVIAQQVELVAPEFVDIDGWDSKPNLDEDGNEIVSDEEPLKSIYTADLHHATIKVLQEAMLRIEEQQAQIDELKALILAK